MNEKFLTTPYAPGAVVLARVMNPLQHAASRGKVRPVCLVRRDGGRWQVVGLTSRRTYATGCPRTPVPNPALVGLRGPGFLWGRATWISALDLYEQIGWVDPQLASLMTLVGGLTPDDDRTVQRAAREHHDVLG